MTSSNSLPQSSVNPIYSVNDWIEEWNRTSLATYRDLLTELDVNGQFTTFASVNHTNNITMTAGVPPGSNVYHDETYTMVLPSNSTVGYIKVEGTLSSTLPSSYELVLVSHPMEYPKM